MGEREQGHGGKGGKGGKGGREGREERKEGSIVPRWEFLLVNSLVRKCAVEEGNIFFSFFGLWGTEFRQTRR